MTPPPKCEKSEVSSMFSVTGFLTFSVVAATSLANIIANINNNNNNNNNNNDNDNQNDNNQMSNNTMAGKRKRSTIELANNVNFCNELFYEENKHTPHWHLNKTIQYLSTLFDFCPQRYICESARESILLDGEVNRKIGLFTTTISGFILSDFLFNLKPEDAVEIIENVSKNTIVDCSTIKCSKIR